MKRKRKIAILLIILINTTLLSGCWNYSDIEKLSIVLGVAIDMNKDNSQYLLTAEVADFELSGKEAKGNSRLVQAEGRTIFASMRNMMALTGKRLFWGHSKIVIISKQLAKKGIAPIIDMLLRDAEIREEMYIIISNKKTARELMEHETVISDMRSSEMSNIIEGQKILAKGNKIRVFEFINIIESEGVDPSVPIFGLTSYLGTTTTKIMGTAVFKKDKMVGSLSPLETRTFLFTINHIKKGLLVEKINTQGNLGNITLEIIQSNTKVKPMLIDGRIVIKMNVKIEVAIGEMGTSVDYIEEKKRKILKAKSEQALKKDIEKVIQKVQTNYDADIFGFGKLVKQNMPNVWKRIGANWDNFFSSLKTEINVDIDVKNSALMNKPIKVRK